MRLTCQVAYRPGLSDPGHSPIPKEPSTTEARWALDLAGPCSYTLCRGASDDSPIGRSHCLTKICFWTLHQTNATQSVSTLHCLTKNLTLRSTRTTPSGII